jgi:hypothetical protein
MMGTFLNEEELAALTGCKWKRKQIEQLRRMKVPFFVNASGRAVVVRTAIEGGKIDLPQEKRGWMPRVVPA